MQTLDDIKPGQTIGRYEFLVPIAKGGMAGVWAARLKGTRGFAKTVAIKTMLPTLSDDPLFEQMFLDEAQIAAQIHHPNVVEIMDLGEQDDVLYQVMEYVDGESLATILRGVRKKKELIPIEVAVRIVTDACRGLHAAHELKSVDGTLMGLVHRDISPQNIMITYDGVVKLVDFGVAKAAGRTASETTAGQIKGKAPYMAPEQALGQRVDRRTDLFAMGIVLYQITTGKHPFRGESDIATLHNILHKDVPSPRFVDPKFPRPLEAVINRALSRQVDKRFSSAKDMADALGRVFPPTHRRVDVADVGNFVQDLLGETGNRRRAALAEAIKRADSRASKNGPAGEISGSVLLPLADIDLEESAVQSQRAIAAATERIDVADLAGGGRASHPGLAPISDLAGRLSAPPTLDLDGDDHRNAETIRPGVRSPVASAPSSPDLEAARASMPSVQGLSGGETEGGAPASDGTPGTAPAAMVSVPDVVEPRSGGGGLKVAVFIGGAIVIGVGIGVTAWSLLRTPPTEDPGSVAAGPALTASAAPPSATESAEPIHDAGPDAPVYDLEAVSEPVEDQDAAPPPATGMPHVPPPVVPATIKPTAPAASAPPPPPATTTAPPATATADSTWKPPPVADPGF